MTNIDPNTKELIQIVQRELSDHLSIYDGSRLKSIRIQEVIKRPFSLILFLIVETSVGLQNMVMKKVVHDPINLSITKRANQALVEYKLLENLYPKFLKVEGCSVPRPIMVIPELEAFIMGFVKGKLLSDEIYNARIWANKKKYFLLKKYFYLCGKWLHHFQEFSDHESAGGEAFNGIIERCDLRLKLIEKSNSSLIESGIRARTINFLEEQIASIGNCDVMISGRHGDFGHWNILVNNSGIVVIDFLGYTKEPILYDITKILISFEALIKDPTFSPFRVDTLRHKFIEGLGLIPYVPYPVAVICEIYHRIAVIYGCLSNSGDNWFERFKKERILKMNLKVFNKIINNNSREAELLWPLIQN